MKLNKVIINGKVYYEEVKENEEKSDIVIENDEEVVKDNDIEEKKNEQLSIKSIELLKDTIGYNEFAEFYKLLFEKRTTV